MGRFTVLEHTADVGLRAEGRDLPDLFETATRGMAEIAGVVAAEAREALGVGVAGGDLGGMLVDWLDEVLFVHDSRGEGVASVEIESVDTTRGVKGRVVLGSLPTEQQGTQIKAVTYHQLSVKPLDAGWEAVVFFDV